MKKILLIIGLFITSYAFAQTGYPTTQTIGSDSAIVKVKGGFSATRGMVNGYYVDTFAANASRISQYPFAQIITDSGTLRVRNNDASGWNIIMPPAGFAYITKVGPCLLVRSALETGAPTDSLLYICADSASLNVTGDSMITYYPWPNQRRIAAKITGTGGGGGSVEYFTEGYGFKIDSTGRVYTGRVDTTVIQSKVGNTALLALKQNLVTLTTTGTSGASTFNQSTGALNIPSYSSSGGVTKAQVPLVINAAGDSVSQRFNVLDYMASGYVMGTTDATTGIQRAINACSAAGGGDVFFPNGIYIIGDTLWANTSNSQIYIPVIAGSSSTRTHIRLVGEVRPEDDPAGFGLAGDAATPIGTKAVILKSTLTSSTGAAFVLGTGGVPVIGSFNTTVLDVENISIQVKNNPGGTGPVVGGIGYKNGIQLNTNFVSVYVDTSGYRSTLPVNDVTGIEAPDNNGGQYYTITNTAVVGFRQGFKIGEHCLLNQATAICCYYGFYFKNGYHSTSATRGAAYWCKYDIYIGGFCTLANFQLDAEWQQIGKWYDDVATVKDSANLSTGQLFYTIIEGGVGKNNAKFVKSGGSNLHTITNDAGVGGSLSIGDLVTSATAARVPYFGTGGALRQSSNFLFDSTNVYLGIGVTPTAKLDIAYTATGAYGVKVTNSTSSTSAAIGAINNTGVAASIASWGSTATSNLPNHAGVTSTDDLLLISDASNVSGGTKAISFRAGGLDSILQEKMRIYANGDIRFNHASNFFWDGTNKRLGLGTASPNQLFHLNGTGLVTGNLGIGASNFAAANKLSVNNYVTTDANAEAMITTTGTTKKGLVLQGVASQTGSLIEAQLSTGTAIFNLTTPTANTTALQVNGQSSGKEAGMFFIDGPSLANSAYGAFVASTSGGYFGKTGAVVIASSKNGSGTQLPISIGGYNGGWTEWIGINTTGITNLRAGSAVASATAIAPTGNMFHVTGTTTITSITTTGLTAGATFTIIFDGALTFTDGSNLKLAGNFTTSADATITLAFDGTNFYELKRSTN